QQERWMDGFESDLPELLEERGLVPDLVLVSGDVAKSAQPVQYEEALKFFRRIDDKLPRRGGRRAEWLFVPGNHDVDWNAVTSESEEDVRAKTNAAADENALEAILTDASTQQYLEKRHKQFQAFLDAAKKSLRTPAPTDPCVLQTKVNGLDVAVVGLNSA